MTIYTTEQMNAIAAAAATAAGIAAVEWKEPSAEELSGPFGVFFDKKTDIKLFVEAAVHKAVYAKKIELGIKTEEYFDGL